MKQAQLIELNYREKASDKVLFEELHNLLITRFTKGDYLQLNAEWKRAHIAGVVNEILMLMEPDEIERRQAQRLVTHHCPNCEAVVRERDAAKAETIDARKRYRTIRDKADSLRARLERATPAIEKLILAYESMLDSEFATISEPMPSKTDTVIQDAKSAIRALLRKEAK